MRSSWREDGSLFEAASAKTRTLSTDKPVFLRVSVRWASHSFLYPGWTQFNAFSAFCWFRALTNALAASTIPVGFATALP